MIGYWARKSPMGRKHTGGGRVLTYRRNFREREVRTLCPLFLEWEDGPPLYKYTL